MPNSRFSIRVGCCGFALAQAKYFRTFRLIEVQQTFYQAPRLETLQRWRLAAPPGFEFTLKAWQLITHEPGSPTYRRLKTPIPEAAHARYGSFRATDEVLSAWHAALAAARALEATAIVFQCPASFTPTAAHVRNLRTFIKATAGETSGLRLCWEPRGEWRPAAALALPPAACIDVFRHRSSRPPFEIEAGSACAEGSNCEPEG